MVVYELHHQATRGHRSTLSFFFNLRTLTLLEEELVNICFMAKIKRNCVKFRTSSHATKNKNSATNIRYNFGKIRVYFKKTKNIIRGQSKSTC